MRKVFSLVLALCLLCAPCVAFADDPPAGEGEEAVTEEHPLETLPEDGEEEGEELPILDSGVIEDALTPPFAVYLVDPPAEGGIEVYASHGTAYPGAISTTVYQYFRDLAASLPLGSHYVFYRADRYRYDLAYSKSLTLSGSTWSSPEVQIVRYDTYNSDNTLTRYSESSFSVGAGSAMVYSDLGEYPRLFEGVSHREITALLLLVAGGFIGGYVLRLFSF